MKLSPKSFEQEENDGRILLSTADLRKNSACLDLFYFNQMLFLIDYFVFGQKKFS